MKAKTVTSFLMVVLSTVILLIGCNNKKEVQTPAEQKIDFNDLKLVQVISDLDTISEVKDVFGRPIESKKFYICTKNIQLIPVTYKRNRLIPGTTMSVEEYAASLWTHGKKIDTIFLPIDSNISIGFKSYPTGEISLDATLN